MKNIRIYIALLAAVIGLACFALTGCKTDRGIYNTLAASEQGVKEAYDGYVDSVINGQARTNELPVIARSFNAFQSSWAVAVDKASGDTNAPVTADIGKAAADLLAAITKAKGAK